MHGGVGGGGRKADPYPDYCPHCGQVHKISVRETYIGTALNDAVDRASMLQRPPVGSWNG
jgi:hypothetical protein